MCKFIISNGTATGKIHKSGYTHAGEIGKSETIGFNSVKVVTDLYNAWLVSKPEVCEICFKNPSREDTSFMAEIENIPRRKKSQ